MDVAQLFVALTISDQPVLNSGSIISLWVQAECEFGLLSLIVKEPTRSTKTMTQGYNVRLCYVGWEQPIFPELLVCYLTYLTSGNKQSMFNLIVFSNLVCPGWSKYSWYQDITLCLLSQWVRNVYLDWYVCSKEDHILKYVVLSNEVGLNPFLLILVRWFLLVIWRSSQYALLLLVWYYWC
jgi:hypothetical protein